MNSLHRTSQCLTWLFARFAPANEGPAVGHEDIQLLFWGTPAPSLWAIPQLLPRGLLVRAEPSAAYCTWSREFSSASCVTLSERPLAFGTAKETKTCLLQLMGCLQPAFCLLWSHPPPSLCITHLLTPEKHLDLHSWKGSVNERGSRS